jgi:hypothetical protein
MKNTERQRLRSVTSIMTVSIVALAWAAATGCTRDMVVGGAIDQGGQGGAGGGGDAGTFTCGSSTCTVGHDFCLMGPTDPGHCVSLPGTCTGTATCGCVCDTPNGGPGTCSSPGRFNYGLSECSCQNLGASSNVAVWCSLPNTTGAGGSGGAGGSEGADAGATFPCGSGTCRLGAEFCLIDPALTRCMALPASCAGTASASSCGCACQTLSGGAGTCPDPGQFNEGLYQCACQNAVAGNAVVDCH